MKKTFLIVLLLFALLCVEGKKISKSRSSSRGSSSRKTSYNPSPTSSAGAASAAQPSAPKPSLFGWQEKPAQRKSSPPQSSQPKQTQSHSYPSQSSQPKQTQSHSYPSSNTGLSGGTPGKQPTNHQESVQRSNVPQSQSASGHANTGQQNPSYPSSNTGLSGNAGSGYPQQHGVGGQGAPPAYSGAGGTNYQGPPPAYSNSGGYPKQQGTGLSGAGAPPPYNSGNYGNNNYGNNYRQPPPPYSPNYGSGGYGGAGYGGHGYGSHGYSPMNTPQMPGYFGGSRGYGGGVGRSSNILTGVGIAGAGVGTVLTGLALWNLARSTGQRHHTVIYDNRGQPVAVAPDNSTTPEQDSILGDLVNCTLTISNDNSTEVLGIPCAIATSFSPGADIKESDVNKNANDSTKCTITVVTKASQEFMTTIPCSTLLNSAAENNVTEPPLLPSPVNGTDVVNGTMTLINPDIPPIAPLTDLPISTEVNTATDVKCLPEPGEERDPINPCFALTSNITVVPLSVTPANTPPVA